VDQTGICRLLLAELAVPLRRRQHERRGTELRIFGSAGAADRKACSKDACNKGESDA
jgi:hypothetical protein